MRIPTVTLKAFLAAGVGVLLGCTAGASSDTPTSLLDRAEQTQSHSTEPWSGLGATGADPRFLSLRHIGSPSQVPPVKLPPRGDLAVSDDGSGVVDIYDDKFKLKYQITAGLNYPNGDWYDSKGNLYVANSTGQDVTEYPPGGKNSNFVYDAAIVDPVDVTTDKAGRIYVADYNDGKAGGLEEFYQLSNQLRADCVTNLANTGVAVDPSGDVFVSGYNPLTGDGNVDEFLPNLSHCSFTTLGVTLGLPGGLKVDNEFDLIVADQSAGTVDIIPPPYEAVSGKCGSGYSDPLHVALDKPQTALFVADPGKANVQFLSYPACKLLGTIGGILDPDGVAASVGKP